MRTRPKGQSQLQTKEKAEQILKMSPWEQQQHIRPGLRSGKGLPCLGGDSGMRKGQRAGTGAWAGWQVRVHLGRGLCVSRALAYE